MEWREDTPRSIRILHAFSRLNCGGAECRTLDVLRFLKHSPQDRPIQMDFCVLSGLPGQLDDEVRSLGSSIHYLPLRKPTFPGRFKRLLRDGQYDVLHSHIHYPSGVLTLIARRVGVPGRVVHFRSESDGRPNTLPRRLMRFLLKQLIDHTASHIVAVSRSAMERSWRKEWQEDSRCQVIYNGLDVTSADQTVTPDAGKAVRQELGLSPSTCLVIHVGGYRPAKNHGKLLGVFAQLRSRVPDSRLILLGDVADGKEKLMSLARTSGCQDAIYCLGVRKDVFRWLAAADVMIFPSVREGLPGAVLEAASVGTPTVASDIAPHREIAAYLPEAVVCVPLAASDQVWAEAAQAVAGPSYSQRVKLHRAFLHSPFSLDRCTAALVKIWQQCKWPSSLEDDSPQGIKRRAA